RRPGAVEEEVGDHEDDRCDRDGEQHETGDREEVRSYEHPLLVVRAPAQAVVRARCDEADGRERRRDERDEEDVAVEPTELREAVREGDGEQKREEHLHTWERDAQLVEELDQLTVAALFFALGHRPRIPRCSGLKGRAPIEGPCWRRRTRSTSSRASSRSSSSSASHTS